MKTALFILGGVVLLGAVAALANMASKSSPGKVSGKGGGTTDASNKTKLNVPDTRGGVGNQAAPDSNTLLEITGLKVGGEILGKVIDAWGSSSDNSAGDTADDTGG